MPAVRLREWSSTRRSRWTSQSLGPPSEMSREIGLQQLQRLQPLHCCSRDRRNHSGFGDECNGVQRLQLGQPLQCVALRCTHQASRSGMASGAPLESLSTRRVRRRLHDCVDDRSKIRCGTDHSSTRSRKLSHRGVSRRNGFPYGPKRGRPQQRWWNQPDVSQRRPEPRK